jgi:exoribonuclease-2
VQISTRQRGAPLDLIVAEAMILANSTWGGWLAELGVPGIYRSQASLAPGIKVRMGTKALPHAGMGVAQYTWAPRRCAATSTWSTSGRSLPAPATASTAALAAPFKPKDASCSPSSPASTPPTAPTTASRRAWSASGRCKYLRSNGITELTASLIKEQPAAACWCAPTRCRWCSRAGRAKPAARHARARALGSDLTTSALHVSGTVHRGAGRRCAWPMPPRGRGRTSAAGPIAIAVDVNEAEQRDKPAAGR